MLTPRPPKIQLMSIGLIFWMIYPESGGLSPIVLCLN